MLYKIYNNYPFLLILSAFSPYLSLSYGIRYDSLLIYGLLILLLPLFLLSNMRISKYTLSIVFLWIFSLTYFLIRSVMGGSSIVSILPELDNFLQPLAILIVTSLIAIGLKMDLTKTSKFLMGVLSLNTVFILLGFYIDFSVINNYFWGGLETTGNRAATVGRFGGVFGQPMESGIAYSLGLFAWLYSLREKEKVKLKHFSILTLLVIGGLLSVSKIFLIGGLGIFFIGGLFNKNIRTQIVKIAIGAVVFGYIPFQYLTTTWNGLNYLTRFFDSASYSQGFWRVITAGRFGGENSQQSRMFSEVYKENPLLGSGFGQHSVIDSGFFHFFASGGMIGLILYICILILLTMIGFIFIIKTNFSHESKFFISILLLIIAASFGAPVFTLNRSSVLIWLLIGMLIRYLINYKQESPKTILE